MVLILVTPPDVEPLTAAEAKARLGFTDADISDDVMNALIKASRQMIDGAKGWPGIALNTQTWDLVIDHFDGFWNTPAEKGFYPNPMRNYSRQLHGHRQGIMIPLPPLQSVVSVKYLDTDGAEQTVDPATYLVHKGEPSHIVLANGSSWPPINPTIPGSVTIRFIAGYGDNGEDVDETLRMAVALQAARLQQMASPDYWISSERVEGIDSVTRSSSAGFTIFSDAVKAMLEPYRVWTQ